MMGVIKGVVCVVGGVVALGVLSGGVVRGPDGTVDPGATFQQGAEIGGDRVGGAVGKAADGLGTGVGNAVVGGAAGSDLAKAAAAGGGAVAAWKAWGRWGGPGLRVGDASGDVPPLAPAPTVPATVPPVAAPEPPPLPQYKPWVPPAWWTDPDAPVTVPSGNPIPAPPPAPAPAISLGGGDQWPAWRPCVISGFGAALTSDC